MLAAAAPTSGPEWLNQLIVTIHRLIAAEGRSAQRHGADEYHSNTEGLELEAIISIVLHLASRNNARRREGLRVTGLASSRSSSQTRHMGTKSVRFEALVIGKGPATRRSERRAMICARLNNRRRSSELHAPANRWHARCSCMVILHGDSRFKEAEMKRQALGDGDPDDLMTAADAAHILELSPDMVRLLARRGTLVASVTTFRGVRLFRRADIERLAQDRKRAADVGR
jgi:hypothetical protein